MKILMVGLGAIGQRHVRNLRTILGDGLELLAYRVRGRSQVLTDLLEVEVGGAPESKYGIVTYDDLNEALAQRPEIVFVCNPSSLHLDVAMQCAQAGCHLFVEKPLSHDWAGVEDFLQVVDQGKLVTFVGYQMRFHPCWRDVQHELQAGAIGRLLAARFANGEYLPDWHKYEDYRESYAARRELGGGVILTQIHEFDLIYSLCGLPRRVAALGGHVSSLQIDVEDVASSLFDCTIAGRSVPVHLHQDFLQRPPVRNCELIGDAGKMTVDFNLPSLLTYDSSGQLVNERTFSDFHRNDMFEAETRHFIDCVRDGTQPLISVRDGAQSLRMALAVKKSLQTGGYVNLN